MRIAFVAHQGSIHTQRWAGFFARRGHDVHVITCGDGSAADVTYAVHDLGAPTPAKSGYLLRIPAARSVIRALDPDIVHAHYATSYGLLALAAGVRPLVVTAHGSDVLLGRSNAVYRQVLRHVFQAASLVTVPSDEMRAAVEALAGPGVPIETFQYGVEAGRLTALADRMRAGSRAHRREIVTARPLRPLYRVDVLLEGLAGLRRSRTDWHCTIFGDGSEREAAIDMAARLQLGSHVSFAGQQPASAVEEALARADVYASFAESDGASMALLEAMTLGCVPVASDIASNRAWIESGANGVLSAIRPDAAAGALDEALTLDRGRVASLNRTIILDRADRERNLGRLERRLEELTGRASG